MSIQTPYQLSDFTHGAADALQEAVQRNEQSKLCISDDHV
jgi:hypothetical protein